LPIQTDFDLSGIVSRTTELQDWMLEEEDRSSIELAEMVEGLEQGVPGQGPSFEPFEEDLQARSRPSPQPIAMVNGMMTEGEFTV
jgi:hypothetical protein